MQPHSHVPAVSESLRAFVEEFPLTRRSILDLVLRAATEIPAGSRILDVGAGDSPYRELFGHVRYESNEWQHSTHEHAGTVDHVGPAHDLPIDDAQFDAVLMTEVLEHVPNPAAVMSELFRILVPGGRLYMTTPFAIEVHGMPWDYFRYAPAALLRMLEDAGFVQVDVRPRTDCLTTLAQLLESAQAMIGNYPDGRDAEREQAKAALRAFAAQLPPLAALDSRGIFPLGFASSALKPPVEPPAARQVKRDHESRAAVGIADARSRVTLCFLGDLLRDRHMLAAYARSVSVEDDATLVIYAPRVDVAEASRAISELVAGMGLDGPDSPDMIGLPFSTPIDERRLAEVTDSVLSLRPPWGAFAGLPWLNTGNVNFLKEQP